MCMVPYTLALFLNTEDSMVLNIFVTRNSGLILKLKAEQTVAILWFLIAVFLSYNVGNDNCMEMIFCVNLEMKLCFTLY